MFIENVKPLQQFMDDGSFLMPEIPAVFRTLQTAGAADFLDYDYLLSVSGMAVRLSWQPGWAEYAELPNQACEFYGTDPLEPIKLALERAGADYKFYLVEEQGIEKAERDIKMSVDRGFPVIVNGISVMSTVTGYDGDDLFGVCTFLPQEKRNELGYNKIENWRSSIKNYIIIEKLSPLTVDKAILANVLKTAVKLARTEKVRNAICGINSFDALTEMLVWDESFEQFGNSIHYSEETKYPYERGDNYWRDDGAHDLGKRFWSGYCDFLCMLNGYDNFSKFLEKYASVVPEWHDKLLSAASYYMRACDYSGELWKYVTPDDAGVLKFKTSEVRYVFAAHMLRAKIYTIKAVESIEQLL